MTRIYYFLFKFFNFIGNEDLSSYFFLKTVKSVNKNIEKYLKKLKNLRKVVKHG